MTKIAVAPLNLASGTLMIGTDEYTLHLNSLTLTPTTPKSSWTALDGSVINVNGTPSWAAALAYVEDIATTNSLTLLALANQGVAKVFAYKPDVTGAKTITFTGLLEAPTLGGSVNTFGNATMNITVNGQPTVA